MHRCNMRPTEPHLADLVTMYINDEDLPLPTPPQHETAVTPTATYVSVLSAERPLENAPTSTTTQGSFPLPDHAIAAIAAILSYYLPHDIDARLHNHQWFLIGQGRHPRRTIFIPSTQRRNARPTEPYPADFVTVYMNDEDLPLPAPPQPETTTESTHEAESSSDLARG